MTLFSSNFLLPRGAAFQGQPWNRFNSVTLLVLVAFASLSVCGVMAFAQVETGQIAGTVMDQTGAAVPNATVAIKNLSTKQWPQHGFFGDRSATWYSALSRPFIR